MSDPIQTNASGVPVTISPEAPSEQIVRRAAKSVDVTDELGRVITLKKPAPLANLDFAKAAGSAGLNQLYLSEVAHLKFVAAIDGQPIVCPGSDGELRALYAQLGDEGNEAAQRGVFANFMPTEDARDAVKNS